MGKLVVATLAAVALGAGLAAVPPERPAVHTLTFVVEPTTARVTGAVVGVSRLERAVLRTPVERRRVGTLHALCTATGPGVELCQATFELPDGSIATQGGRRAAGREGADAVVGGTGRYAGARGEARHVAADGGGRAVVLRLLR